MVPDPAVQAAIEQLVREKDAAEALAFTDRVRRVLRSMVLAGTATADQVSFMFAMSRRTLHRELAAEGTSLRQLAIETRFEVARQLLNGSDMPAGEIAAVLHYADSSAFSRAFKEWSGTSPREWRQAIRRASAGAAAQPTLGSRAVTRRNMGLTPTLGPRLSGASACSCRTAIRSGPPRRSPCDCARRARG